MNTTTNAETAAAAAHTLFAVRMAMTHTDPARAVRAVNAALAQLEQTHRLYWKRGAGAMLEPLAPSSAPRFMPAPREEVAVDAAPGQVETFGDDVRLIHATGDDEALKAALVTEAERWRDRLLTQPSRLNAVCRLLMLALHHVGEQEALVQAHGHDVPPHVAILKEILTDIIAAGGCTMITHYKATPKQQEGGVA